MLDDFVNKSIKTFFAVDMKTADYSEFIWRIVTFVTETSILEIIINI